MKRWIGTLGVVAAFLLVLGSVALARETEETTPQDTHWGESPMWGTWSINLGMKFFENIHYKDVYGSSGIAFYNMNASYKIIKDFELVGGIGYGFSEGRGVAPDTGERTAEKYKLHVAPGTLGFLYRFNFVLDQPVVPYVGAAGMLSYWMEERVHTSWKRKSYNYGALGNGGLMFLLDKLEKRASGLMEAQWGINNSYVFLEYRYDWLNNFGQKDIIDLNASFYSAGILLEF